MFWKSFRILVFNFLTHVSINLNIIKIYTNIFVFWSGWFELIQSEYQWHYAATNILSKMF